MHAERVVRLLLLVALALATAALARFDPKNPRVEDRLALFELFTQYCTAVDTRDLELFRDVFTQDALLDYSANVFIGKGAVADMAPQIIGLMNIYSATVHQWSNAEIEFTGPSTARARFMLNNPMFLQGFPVFPFNHVHGYYNHDLVKSSEDGKWRSKHMRMEISVGALGQVIVLILFLGYVARGLLRRN